MSERNENLHSVGSAIIHESIERAEIVHVFGELDLSNAAELESVILNAVRIAKHMIVDFRECSYIDSTIISVLIRARKALGDHLRVLVQADGPVFRVLHITEVDRIIATVTSFGEAVAV